MSTIPHSYYSQRLSQDQWILLRFWKDEIASFDRQVDKKLLNAHTLLSNVPLAVFGATLLQPEKYYPRAHIFLPTMASDYIQKAWTGSSDTDLLETSIAFVQQTLTFCSQHLGRLHSDMRILDFGIGWGRIARLWLKYLPVEQVKGCDAWDQSIDIARSCCLKNEIIKSEPLLKVLPYPLEYFDIVYAMSIFTHLDEQAFSACLGGITKMLKKGGGVIFTVRPNIFWETLRKDLGDHSELSQSTGFVFRQASLDPHFGDTTVDLEWINNLARSHGLNIVGIDWSPADAMQICIQAIRLS